MDDTAAAFYASNPIVGAGNLAITPIEGTGKGVRTLTALERGDILFTERPILALQHVDNRSFFRACERCLRSVGSIRDQWVRCLTAQQRSSDSDEHEHEHSQNGGDDGHKHADHKHAGDGAMDATLLPDPLPFTAVDASGASSPLFEAVRYEVSPVPCAQACGDEYCSENCRAAAWQEYHQLCCPKHLPHANGSNDLEAHHEFATAIENYRQFASENNEIFFLILKLVANVLLTRSFYPYSLFSSSVWWQQAQPPASLTPSEQQQFRATLMAMCDEAAAHMQTIFHPQIVDEFDYLFETEMIGRLVTIFEMNQLALFAPSPIATYLAFYHSLTDKEQQAFKAQIPRALFVATNDISERRIEGVGLFTVACCLNHSCEPNFLLVKRDNEDEAAGFVDLDCTMAAMATRDVAEGEEATFSYIDEDAPLDERTELLAEYGFVCECPKCQRERLAHDKGIEDSSDSDSDINQFEDDDADEEAGEGADEEPADDDEA